MTSPVTAVFELTDKFVTSLVTKYREGYATAHNGGFALSDFLAAAKGGKLPANPIEAHIVKIADAIATDAGKMGAEQSDRNYRSNCRKIIRWHDQLPEAMVGFKAEVGECGFGAAVKLCVALKETDGNVKAAVALCTATKAAKAADINVNFQRAIKAMLKGIRKSNPKSDAKKQARLVHIEALITCATAMGYTPAQIGNVAE